MMSMRPIISRAAMETVKGDFEAEDAYQESVPTELSSDKFRKRNPDIRKNVRLLAG